MSDPLNLLVGKKPARYDPPDSPRSVGWTFPRRVRLADRSNPLPLDCGRDIWPVDMEYETYGALAPGRDNAILVFHALSGDAHAAGWDRNAEHDDRTWRGRRPGWWDSMIGPGKGLDTRRYFVICSNVLGGCYGATGPSSLDPETGRPYGLRFPVVTVGDWVRLQKRLIDHLGIHRLLAVAGGSLGGQQAMEWALAAPDRVRGAIVLAAAPRLSAQGLAFNAVARRAIMCDPGFLGGDYYGEASPGAGLGLARMIGHITYLSETSMARKFGRRLQNGERPGFRFDPEFEVESYLEHQQQAFVERFDANTYLYITKAMDYYDAAAWGDGDLVRAASRAGCSWLVASFSSDWLYPPDQCFEWANALRRAGSVVTYRDIESSYGHDAFLLETEKVTEMVAGFLDRLDGRGGN